MLYKMIYFSSHKFAFSNFFFAILRTFSSITREICVQIKNKVHHVNQLIEPDLMMCIHMAFSKKKPLHPLHSTELFKIFFSLLTLSTAFLQKACGPGKNHYMARAKFEVNIIDHKHNTINVNFLKLCIFTETSLNLTKNLNLNI